MGYKLPLGAVIGAVAGMVAGVLTAPKSGRETRADIKVKADEMKKKAQKAGDEAVTAADDLKNKLKK